MLISFGMWAQCMTSEDCHCLLSLCLRFRVACQVLSQTCDTLTKTLTWGQTSGVPQGTTTAVSSVFEQHLCRDSCWKSDQDTSRMSMTFSKSRSNSPMCRLKAITGSRVFWSGLHSSVPSAKATFWPRVDVHGLGEWQGVSPVLAVVPQAWHRLHNTRLEVSQREVQWKPHQRLAYLSSLQSTCATLSVWWELKLHQNSPSSCNYSLLSHK